MIHRVPNVTSACIEKFVYISDAESLGVSHNTLGLAVCSCVVLSETVTNI